MKLLKFEGYKLTIEPELLTLKSFKKIWNRDRSPDKQKAILEIGYIYHFCDPRSDYNYITDLVTRKEAIKVGEGFPETWEPDAIILEAMSFYTSFKTTAVLLLEDTRLAIDKVRKGLQDIDLTKTDDKGKLVYSLATVTATIRQIPSLIEELNKAEKAIHSDLAHTGKMRGTGEKTIMEDSLDI
jgi:hypothetical protein